MYEPLIHDRFFLRPAAPQALAEHRRRALRERGERIRTRRRGLPSLRPKAA